MKKAALFISALIACFVAVSAATKGDVKVRDFMLERNGSVMTVDLDLDIDSLKVDANRAVVLTPVLYNGADSLDLYSVAIYGRRRFYYYQRNTPDMLTGPNELSFRANEQPDSIGYHENIDWAEWFEGGNLGLRRRDFGCCNSLVFTSFTPLYTDFRTPITEPFMVDMIYIAPKMDLEKIRELKASAYIDFPVNRTEIYPDYRKNPVELPKIINSIDSVRNDPDITVTALSIKGFASPEGPYKNNVRLSIGRTAALKDYVNMLYHFPADFITTSNEPEDWEGLRNYVVQSALPHRDEILALIDSSLEPDAKDAKIKKDFPKEWEFLYTTVYPGLRHSDYRIEYKIRTFSNPDTIRQYVRTAPQKLSMYEFFVAAQDLQPGSDEFREIFETAVRMYPNDSIANLNAANAAVVRRDVDAAERYLAKAGDVPQATYARGVIAAIREDYPTARALFLKAKEQGVKEADAALEALEPYEAAVRKAAEKAAEKAAKTK